jgi:hypothetical protein
MSRAHYDSFVKGGIIYVIDDNDGAMSVTNDAEAVVEEVVKLHGNLPVKYRDTDGRWDWLVHEHGKFITFAPGNKPYPTERP